MKHRHIVDQTWSVSAIDSLIERGDLKDWKEFFRDFVRSKDRWIEGNLKTSMDTHPENRVFLQTIHEELNKRRDQRSQRTLKIDSKKKKELSCIFGSEGAALVLLALIQKGPSHLREICKFSGLYPAQAKNQIEKFLQAGILSSYEEKNRSVITFNEGNPLATQVKGLFS